MRRISFRFRCTRVDKKPERTRRIPLSDRRWTVEKPERVARMLVLTLNNRMLAHNHNTWRCEPPSLNTRESDLDAIYASSSSLYLQETRERMVGAVPSHVLLEADNTNELLPRSLQRDANALQFVYVDEPRCIGCRNCAEVARSTFRMEENFGAARVFQQCGDDADVIEEAVLCCPVDCIHEVSFNELRILEKFREGMLNDGSMAAAQGAGKIAARAEGRDGAPSWRAPLRGMSRDANGLEAPPDNQQGTSSDAGALGLDGGGGYFTSAPPPVEGVEADAFIDATEMAPDEERPETGVDKDVLDALFGGYADPVLDDHEAQL